MIRVNRKRFDTGWSVLGWFDFILWCDDNQLRTLVNNVYKLPRNAVIALFAIYELGND